MDSNISTWLVSFTTGGLSTAIVTYQLNRNKEESFFMRKKAEELYMATDEWVRMFSGHIVMFMSLVDEQIDYNQYNELFIKNPPKKESGGLETIEMNINIYFPEIKNELSELILARDEFQKLKNAHKEAYKNDAADREMWRPVFDKSAKRADMAMKALKVAIINSARKYAGVRGGIHARFLSFLNSHRASKIKPTQQV